MNVVWPVLKPVKKQVTDTGVANGKEIQLTRTPVKGSSISGTIGTTPLSDKSGRLYGKSNKVIGTISYTTGKITLVHPRKNGEFAISYDVNEILAAGTKVYAAGDNATLRLVSSVAVERIPDPPDDGKRDSIS
jgi:hypothetical protein